MSIEQIEDTAIILIAQFYYLKIDDFLICFNNAKLGLYGKSYDRLDGMVICEWLNAYDSDRTAKIEEYKSNERKSFDKKPKNEDLQPIPEWVKAKFNEMFKEKTQKKAGTVTEKTWEQYQFDKKVARWEKQFENLYKKFGENKGGYRFVKVGNLALSRQEFTEYKRNLYIKRYKKQTNCC